MKKLRLFLSIMAFVFAVSATFATQYRSSFAVNGWEFVQGIDEPDRCVERLNLNCDTSSANLCTINSNKVGNSSMASTSCGTQYKKQ